MRSSTTTSLVPRTLPTRPRPSAAAASSSTIRSTDNPEPEARRRPAPPCLFALALLPASSLLLPTLACCVLAATLSELLGISGSAPVLANNLANMPIRHSGDCGSVWDCVEAGGAPQARSGSTEDRVAAISTRHRSENRVAARSAQVTRTCVANERRSCAAGLHPVPTSRRLTGDLVAPAQLFTRWSAMRPGPLAAPEEDGVRLAEAASSLCSRSAHDTQSCPRPDVP